MNFGDFLGNEGIKARLSAALAKGQLSHCYLITGPAGAGKKTLARQLAAAAQCSAQDAPCGCCNSCRKVLGGVHADVITVDDPEKKTIPVRLVRQTCADLFLRPNEGRRKIYIFPRAGDLNPQGQNALLKCIEEPPGYGMFLLLCDHAEQLLPTILSRCVQLRLAPLPEQTLQAALQARCPDKDPEARQAAIRLSGGWLGRALELLQEDIHLLPQSEALVEAWCSGTPGNLLRVLTPMERLKREQLLPILLQWHRLFSGALEVRSGMAAQFPACRRLAGARSAADLYAAVDAVGQAITLAEANVGPAHICGALAIQL